MPFDEEPEQVEAAPRVSLKKVSSQKSIFENMPKKPTKEDLQQTVKKIEENNSSYKSKAAELALAFKKAMSDKTLSQNRNVFIQETEQELLSNMVNLAIEVNNDPNEQESMGSLMWVILLLKNSLAQRDRINALEYEIFQLKNKINAGLDNKKINE